MIEPKGAGIIGIRLLVLAVLGCNLIISAPVFAQVAGATLEGTVTDTSGATVPGVQISIGNVATAVTRTVTANSDGFYSAPNLLPGAYEATATRSGFASEVRSGITLTVGADQILNFTLQVGQITQKIEVTGTVPDVQLATSAIGTVVDSNSIVELPLNGRDWTSLAALQPGVDVATTQYPVAGTSTSSSRGVRGFGTDMTISGTRPQQNNYRVDGISVVDYAGGGPGNATGIVLGIDALKEFSVLTANYTAEYGRSSGGVVNAVTRSGTNQLHGTASWFLRDEGLDAKAYFDASRPSFHRNQFSGSVGGPIQKDKTFFFADYEGLRQAKGVTGVNIVPSADARNGIIHNADGTTTVLTVDPQVQPFLGLYALPNAGLIGLGNTGFYDVAEDNVSVADFVTGRMDRKMSDKDSISGTWYYERGNNTVPSTLNDTLLAAFSRRQVATLEETHIFSPSLVNSLHGGYNRMSALDNDSFQAINPLAADTTLGVVPGYTAPQYNVAGLTGFEGGLGASNVTREVWNSFQIYDDAFLNKGVHSLKFGFGFERMQTNTNLPRSAHGMFVFSSLANYLTNNPKAFFGVEIRPDLRRSRGERQSLFAGYLQDDWRLRPNLTLNLGLRYEAVTVPTEVHNEISNLPTFTSPYPQGLRIGSPYFNNATLRDFEPRLGFSWDPFHNGKTAVRGAFGMFDALPLEYNVYSAIALAVPFAVGVVESNPAQGSFPRVPAVSSTTINPLLAQFESIQANPQRNYIMIWNLNVQRQLTPSTAVTVGYVGNRGVHMMNQIDEANFVVPTQTPLGYLWPSPTGSGTVINPAIGSIRAQWWGGDSYYDALTVEVSKRMSHGLQVHGSYTFGKAIDTGSANIKSGYFQNSITSLPWYCSRCRRGPSDFNVAQTLVVDYIWDVPTGKNLGTIGSHILGGWEVGGIITAEGGVPITPVLSGDALGMGGSDPYDYPVRIKDPGCSSAVNPGNVLNYVKLNCFTLPSAPSSFAGCAPGAFPGAATPPPAGQIYCSNLMPNVGRNSIIGPGLVTYDFSLFKNNYIRKVSESFNVQFRAEFFNILNRPNFGTPVDNSALFDNTGAPIGGAGALDTLTTDPREIQFALKLVW